MGEDNELTTIFDKWLYAIRHLPELLEKPKIMEEEVFTRLFQQAEIAHFSRKELQEYEESLKAYRDWYSIAKTAFNKGVTEGIEQGIEQGREEGRAEGREEGRAEGIMLVAKNLKEQGWDVHEIAKLTSLSIPEIERL